jgi:hypothetical protein
VAWRAINRHNSRRGLRGSNNSRRFRCGLWVWIADDTRIPKTVTRKAPRAEKAVVVDDSVVDTAAVNGSSVKTYDAVGLGNSNTKRQGEGDNSDGSGYQRFASQAVFLIFGPRLPISHLTDGKYVGTSLAVSRLIA